MVKGPEDSRQGVRELDPDAAQSGPGQSARYNFEVPKHLTISEMLMVQLADCVRVTRTLSDYASDPRLEDVERMHTIHSLENVVKTSEILTRTISRIGGDSWDEQQPPKSKR